MGLAVSGSTAYVTEGLAGTLLKVDLVTGAKTVIAKGLNQPRCLALLPDGRVAVVEAGAKRVVAIDPASGAVTEIAADLHIGLPPAGKLPVPNGIAVGKSGAIYVSSDIDNSIYKITKN
jgi:glucose/arabinose dehydrogenase